MVIVSYRNFILSFYSWAILYFCFVYSVVNWMLSGHYPELDLAATALKVLQLVTLCHFHWIQAWRILHREAIARTVWFPLMGIFSTYVVAVAAIGILDVGPSWTECLSKMYFHIILYLDQPINILGFIYRTLLGNALSS